MSAATRSARAASTRIAARRRARGGAVAALVGVLLVVGVGAGAHRQGAPKDPPAGNPPTAPDAKPSERKAPGSKRAEKRSETRALFDGRTLDGWKVFVPNGEDGSKTFTVADGRLVCSGSPAGYIATEEEFESFELELEWRFDPAKGAGNSGVLLRVDAKDQVWPRSIEAQLHSGNAGDIYNIGEVPMKADPARTEGRRTKKLEPSSEKPLGEWNKYRITLDGGKLELRVNDVLQNTVTECEVRKGRIALQSEGAHIEFRNVKLRPLGGKKQGAE